MEKKLPKIKWEGKPLPQGGNMEKGKNNIEKLKLVDRAKKYLLEEAVSLIKQTAVAKFDETIELAIKLNVDPKKSDQQLRGATVLPNGIGKIKRILVIAKGEEAKAAEKAKADFVGDADMIAKIEKENWFGFDVMIATPDMMPALGKIGKILGPKGLMPNPKTGTVTTEVIKAIEDVKKGRVEYRTDSYGNIHAGVGKVSFDEKKIIENIKFFVNLIVKEKPAMVKGKYIKSIAISSTMGPGIKIDQNSFDI